MNRVALALVAAAVAACSVSPTAPVVTLDYDPVRAFDRVTLRWMPPTAGDLTGYAIERRVVPHAFEIVGTAPVESHSFVHTIAAETAELTDFEFRVRALPDEGGSRASAPTPFHRGLRPPALACASCDPGVLCDCWPVNGAVALALTNRSQVADGLLLERAVYTAPTAVPTQSAFPLPAVSQTFRDTDGATAWVDGAKLEYRLLAVKGAERSGAAQWGLSAAAPPLPARILSATIATGGAMEVAFANESRSAETFTLVRRDWSTGAGTPWFIASIPAPATGATAVLRDVAPVAGNDHAYYAVRAWLPFSWGWVNSDAWLVWPPLATDMVASVAVVPPGTAAVRMEGGAFATAELARGTTFHLYAPGALGAMYVSSDAWLAYPGLALDPQRLPHAVYALGFFGPSNLVHAWHDGEAWRSEDLGPISSTGDRVGFDVAPDGTVLAAWAASGSVLVARRSPEGLSTESVPVVELPSGSPFVAGDASGGVHVVVWSATGSVHLHRDPGGAWTSEPIPAVPFPLALLAHARGLALVGEYSGSAWILERTAGGWGTVETLGTSGPYHLGAARSPDGERIAVAAGAGTLWLRDGAGTTTRTWTQAGHTMAVGFGPTGKAWVLSGIDAWPNGATNPVALYDEP